MTKGVCSKGLRVGSGPVKFHTREVFQMKKIYVVKCINMKLWMNILTSTRYWGSTDIQDISVSGVGRTCRETRIVDGTQDSRLFVSYITYLFIYSKIKGCRIWTNVRVPRTSPSRVRYEGYVHKRLSSLSSGRRRGCTMVKLVWVTTSWLLSLPLSLGHLRHTSCRERKQGVLSLHYEP